MSDLLADSSGRRLVLPTPTMTTPLQLLTRFIPGSGSGLWFFGGTVFCQHRLVCGEVASAGTTKEKPSGAALT